MKKKKSIFVAVLIFVIVLLGSLWFLVNITSRFNFFSVRSIECKTQYGPCTQEDLKPLDSFLGRNIFSVTRQEVRTILLQDFKNEEVQVEKLLPGRLVVNITKKKALVAIRKGLSSGLFTVSKDGVVLANEPATALPVLSLGDEFAVPQVGARIKDEVLQADEVLYLVKKAQGASFGKLSGNLLEIQLPSQVTVYFPTEKDPKVLVGALELILAQPKIQSHLPKVIDLRYSKAVLRY